MALGDVEGEMLEAYSFPFLAHYVTTKPNRHGDGILGLSPHDDSSGPLFVEHLYE